MSLIAKKTTHLICRHMRVMAARGFSAGSIAGRSLTLQLARKQVLNASLPSATTGLLKNSWLVKNQVNNTQTLTFFFEN